MPRRLGSPPHELWVVATADLRQSRASLLARISNREIAARTGRPDRRALKGEIQMEPIDQLHARDGRRLRTAAGVSLLAAALVLAAMTARSEAAFPGQPGKISFDSTRDGNTEIYVMNADGSEQTRLTDELAIDRDAAFSPDGQRIAFVSERDGNSEVYVMNADGSGQT